MPHARKTSKKKPKDRKGLLWARPGEADPIRLPEMAVHDTGLPPSSAGLPTAQAKLKLLQQPDTCFRRVRNALRELKILGHAMGQAVPAPFLSKTLHKAVYPSYEAEDWENPPPPRKKGRQEAPSPPTKPNAREEIPHKNCEDRTRR